MMLPKGASVAVADGEKLSYFENAGDEANLKLIERPLGAIDDHGKGSGSRQASAGNPDESQSREDGFSTGIVQRLNSEVLGGSIQHLVIIAAPRALGEMRKHYHKELSARLLGEISKDLTGHSLLDIEKAIAAA